MYIFPKAKESLDRANTLSIDKYTKKVIIDNECKINETKIASILGISRKTLWEKREKFGISKVRPNDKRCKV